MKLNSRRQIVTKAPAVARWPQHVSELGKREKSIACGVQVLLNKL